MVTCVVEKEYKNSPNDMETITMWADMSSKATNAQRKAAPDTHVQNAILSTDVAKIRRDAEIAIQKDVKRPDFQIADRVELFQDSQGKIYEVTLEQTEDSPFEVQIADGTNYTEEEQQIIAEAQNKQQGISFERIKGEISFKPQRFSLTEASPPFYKNVSSTHHRRAAFPPSVIQ